jgi:spore maturation protein CgeB
LKTLATWKHLTEHIKIIFAYQSVPKPSLVSRILHRLRIPRDIHSLNNRLRLSVDDFKPDLVFIVKGVLVKPSTLKYIKSRGGKTVSWSNDDMYAWHNRSLWYTWSLPYYDLVVTQKSYNCNPDELPSLGARVLFQNKAFDPEINYPIKNCQDFDCVHEVIFIGTKEEDRLQHLIYLAENGVDVHIYGWGEDDRGKYHEKLHFHHRHLYGDEFNAALGCSKIALNFLRKMNRDLQTSRSVEIPACGGFMLAERTGEHQSLFEEGKEAEYFSSKEELLQKVNYYLEEDEARRTVASNGYRRCFRDDYTFKNRMQEILSKLADESKD